MSNHTAPQEMIAGKTEPARADDERVLKWLRLSAAGASFSEIADLYETKKSVVAGAIRRVDDAMRKAEA